MASLSRQRVGDRSGLSRIGPENAEDAAVSGIPANVQ
jgi:hypothetical protein